jgi:transcriptional regulator with XRE-family HTH domain
MTFSERLKEARRIRDITQVELGRASGIATCQIAQFEADIRKPSMDNLRKLCEALNVSADYLLGITEYPFITQNTVVMELMSCLSNHDFETVMNLLRFFNKENT